MGLHQVFKKCDLTISLSWTSDTRSVFDMEVYLLTCALKVKGHMDLGQIKVPNKGGSVHKNSEVA